MPKMGELAALNEVLIEMDALGEDFLYSALHLIGRLNDELEQAKCEIAK